MIDFSKLDVSREDSETILAIVKRTPLPGAARLSLTMDLEACHANGCPLDLVGLLNADKFNFWHDIDGIIRHMDRETGKLDGRFLPRYAKRRGVTA